jgi:hypothetical protein
VDFKFDLPHGQAVERDLQAGILRAGTHSAGLCDLRNGKQIDVGSQFSRIQSRLFLGGWQIAERNSGGQNSSSFEEPATRDQIKASLTRFHTASCNINQTGQGTKIPLPCLHCRSATEDSYLGSPVLVFRMYGLVSGAALKLNMGSNLPARASNDPGMRSLSSQLSSMKRRIEVWSVTEWST